MGDLGYAPEPWRGGCVVADGSIGEIGIPVEARVQPTDIDCTLYGIDFQ